MDVGLLAIIVIDERSLSFQFLANPFDNMAQQKAKSVLYFKNMLVKDINGVL